jgi:hypothetical protein
MTINFTPGVTQSVWMSLRELAPIGFTSSFQFTFTNDITGATKSFFPQDQQPTNKWSRFNLCVKAPENLANGQINMKSGMWSYIVSASGSQIQSGKVMVLDAMTWSAVERAPKNTGAIRR